MSSRDTIIRSMHDLGLATWFGGSLMGAVGLNGAASAARDPQERLRLSSLGWKKWSPVAAAAIGTHAIGGAGLIVTNRERVRNQDGAGSNTAVKFALTVAAAGLTAYSGVLGGKVEQHAAEGAETATEPGATSSKELASAQKQLKLVQYAIPAITGVLLVMGAVQGEQQRPGEQLKKRFSRS